jgi:hypothetical protein
LVVVCRDVQGSHPLRERLDSSRYGCSGAFGGRRLPVQSVAGDRVLRWQGEIGCGLAISPCREADDGG